MTTEQIIQIIMYVVVGLAAIASSVMQFVKTGKFETTVTKSSEKMVVHSTEQTTAILDKISMIDDKLTSMDARVADLELKVQRCELFEAEKNKEI